MKRSCDDFLHSPAFKIGKVIVLTEMIVSAQKRYHVWRFVPEFGQDGCVISALVIKIFLKWAVFTKAPSSPG